MSFACDGTRRDATRRELEAALGIVPRTRARGARTSLLVIFDLLFGLLDLSAALADPKWLDRSFDVAGAGGHRGRPQNLSMRVDDDSDDIRRPIGVTAAMLSRRLTRRPDDPGRSRHPRRQPGAGTHA